MFCRSAVDFIVIIGSESGYQNNCCYKDMESPELPNKHPESTHQMLVLPKLRHGIERNSQPITFQLLAHIQVLCLRKNFQSKQLLNLSETNPMLLTFSVYMGESSDMKDVKLADVLQYSSVFRQSNDHRFCQQRDLKRSNSYNVTCNCDDGIVKYKFIN